MHFGISEGRLLAAIGMNEGGSAKSILYDLYQRTLSTPQTRAIAAYIQALDYRFERPTQDLLMQKMSYWDEFKKKRQRLPAILD